MVRIVIGKLNEGFISMLCTANCLWCIQIQHVPQVVEFSGVHELIMDVDNGREYVTIVIHYRTPLYHCTIALPYQ